MPALRILHVDDQPDIRELVNPSLSLDPAFCVRSCGAGLAALSGASDWAADLMLIDFTMPGMDVPATLASRATPATSRIPVVFMTARAQPQEMKRLKALGAVGLIAKPLDPMTLAREFRNCLRSVTNHSIRVRFMKRLREEVAGLVARRSDMRADEEFSAALRVEIENVVPPLFRVGAHLGLLELSDAADALAQATAASTADSEAPDRLRQRWSG